MKKANQIYYRLGDGMKEVLNTLNEKDGCLKITKGQYELITTETLHSNYGSENQILRYDVRIYDTTSKNPTRDLADIGWYSKNPIQIGITKLRWMPTLKEQKGKYISIKDVVKLVRGAEDDYNPVGVSGLIKSYYEWPCVVAYAQTNTIAFMVIKTKTKYAGLRYVNAGWNNNIERISPEHALKLMDELVNEKVNHVPLDKEHKTKLIALMI